MNESVSIQDRLRTHSELLGVYVDTERVVADLLEAADEIDRLRAWKVARIENHPTDTEFYGR